ncbi:MAG: hypothetical protein E6Q97_22570, partial [Desulfurellales bacterium]
MLSGHLTVDLCALGKNCRPFGVQSRRVHADQIAELPQLLAPTGRRIAQTDKRQRVEGHLGAQLVEHGLWARENHAVLVRDLQRAALRREPSRDDDILRLKDDAGGLLPAPDRLRRDGLLSGERVG